MNSRFLHSFLFIFLSFLFIFPLYFHFSPHSLRIHSIYSTILLEKKLNFTLVLKESTTEAALPVQLMRINPKHRAACAKPKRANTLAPAPSPNPMMYFTCKKSNTVTKSSPRVFNDGNAKLKTNGFKVSRKRKTKPKWLINWSAQERRKTAHESGSVSALSAWPGTSIWMKHERSLISVMHGLFTNSWNDVSSEKSFSIKIIH